MISKFTWLGCLGMALLLSACNSTRTTNTARTGMEQLLISNAIDQTLDRTPLPPVSGRKVFLEEKYLDCVDKGYLVGSLRQRLLQEGALLVGKVDDAEVVVEVRSGGVGTDNTDRFVGMPGLAVPGPFPMNLPEIRLYERYSQFGTAKLGIVALDAKSGEILFDSGRHLARSENSRWSVLGLGPFPGGTIRREIDSSSAISPVRTTRTETIIR